MHKYVKFAKRVENFLRRIFFRRIVYFYAYQLNIFFSKRVDNRIFYFYTFQPMAGMYKNIIIYLLPKIGKSKSLVENGIFIKCGMHNNLLFAL